MPSNNTAKCTASQHKSSASRPTGNGAVSDNPERPEAPFQGVEKSSEVCGQMCVQEVAKVVALAAMYNSGSMQLNVQAL